ncbi:MAG TPA: hypothetical protein DCX06_06955 [Opitutae bacterium]|nr:hypothetical protein [Opitutae bacterium]
MFSRTAQYGVVIFDYDSTIAEVPVNWLQARKDYRDYLNFYFPSLCLPNDSRVDEMEALALRHAPDAKEVVFRFRFDLEQRLDGGHKPLLVTCAFIRRLNAAGKHRLFILSNNLHRTVQAGLNQLVFTDTFEGILGVDDVEIPKPAPRGFSMLKEMYGISVEDSIFVGDNDRTDGGFCRTLGIPFINIKEK